MKIRIRVMILLGVLSMLSCAGLARELRSGWVKVDFVSGEVDDEVVCRVVKGEELSAKCIPLDDYLTGLLEKMNDLGMLRDAPVPEKATTL